MAASRQLCICCHDRAQLGVWLDKALVVAYLAGASSARHNVSIHDGLCAKHAALAEEAERFAKRSEAS